MLLSFLSFFGGENLTQSHRTPCTLADRTPRSGSGDHWWFQYTVLCGLACNLGLSSSNNLDALPRNLAPPGMEAPPPLLGTAPWTEESLRKSPSLSFKRLGKLGTTQQNWWQRPRRLMHRQHEQDNTHTERTWQETGRVAAPEKFAQTSTLLRMGVQYTNQAYTVSLGKARAKAKDRSTAPDPGEERRKVCKIIGLFCRISSLL